MSMDYMKKSPDPSSSRERVFYHPIVNNLSIHVRCLLSLWEGLLSDLFSPPVDVPQEKNSWSCFDAYR